MKEIAAYSKKRVLFPGIGEMAPAMHAVWYLAGQPPGDGSSDVWQRALSDLHLAVVGGYVDAYARRSVFEPLSPIFMRRLDSQVLQASIFAAIGRPIHEHLLEFFFLPADIDMVQRARLDPSDTSPLAVSFRKGYAMHQQDPTGHRAAVWAPVEAASPRELLAATVGRMDEATSKSRPDEIRSALVQAHPGLAWIPTPASNERWIAFGTGANVTTWSKASMQTEISRARDVLSGARSERSSSSKKPRASSKKSRPSSKARRGSKT